MAKWSSRLTTNQEVAGSIPDTSTVLKWIRSERESTQPHENSWVTT